MTVAPVFDPALAVFTQKKAKNTKFFLCLILFLTLRKRNLGQLLLSVKRRFHLFLFRLSFGWVSPPCLEFPTKFYEIVVHCSRIENKIYDLSVFCDSRRIDSIFITYTFLLLFLCLLWRVLLCVLFSTYSRRSSGFDRALNPDKRNTVSSNFWLDQY